MSTFSFPEYESYDAIGLAELVRRGDITAGECLQAAYERYLAYNPTLNAITHEFYTEARQTIALADTHAPLFGVPFLLKDLMTAYKGKPLTFGSNYLQHYQPSDDCELVKRYKQAGLLIWGKTNTPEFGLSIVTEPALFGKTRNPYHSDYTAGGSSGGAASAVAAGIVPIAHGSDGGGSIRIPASCCGIFGFKPSRGLVPVGPFVLRMWQGCAVQHILSHSVRDSALVLDLTKGASIGEPFVTAPAKEPYLQAIEAPLRPLRIAVCSRSFLGGDIHPDCLAAVEKTRKLCQSLGHKVIPVQPDFINNDVVQAFITLISAEIGALMNYFHKATGRKPKRHEIELSTRLFIQAGKQFRAYEMSQAINVLDRASLKVATFFQDVDILLTPTLAQPPMKHGVFAPSRWEKNVLTFFDNMPWLASMHKLLTKLCEPVMTTVPFSAIFNISGSPAASLPLHKNSEGLPIGCQIAAACGNDSTVLQLARQLERECPWRLKVPFIVK